MVIQNAALVTIRNSSTRLPNKAIMKIKKDIRAVDIVLKRASKTGFKVILTTSTDATDDIFEEIAKEHKVNIFRGSLYNKIKRWYDCFNKFNLDNGILIDGDDLSFDFEIGKRAIDELIRSNSEIIECPTQMAPGLFTYAITKNGIEKLFKIANENELDTDVITKFIEKSKIKKQFVSMKEFERSSKVRLTLDYYEDLEFYKKLYENVDILASGEKILEFLNKNQYIAQINFYKHKDYLENQSSFNEKIK